MIAAGSMATYEELRDALRHINDADGDPNAWQRGLSASDIADITGYLNAETSHQLLTHPAIGSAIYGWLDPSTHRAYPYQQTSTGEHPQVPDTLIGSLRNHHPGLFGPGGQLTSPPAVQPPPRAAGPGLATSEQQSGRTVDAVAKLQDELKKRYTQLNAAEEQLSEVLLNAHATSADGQQKLDGIQQKLIEAVDNPSSALDTPAGESQFLKFLRTQVGAIATVLNAGALTAADSAKAVQALADLYAADGDANSAPPAAGGRGPADPAPAAAPPPPTAPAPEPAPRPDGGAAEPMPDPSLSDLGVGPPSGPAGAMPDPLSALVSTLPAAMGAFPPGLGLGGLAGLPAAAGPLGGLGSLPDTRPVRDAVTDDRSGDGADRSGDGVSADPGGKDGSATHGGSQENTGHTNNGSAQPDSAVKDTGTHGPPPPGDPAPPAPTPSAAPAPVSTTVQLPDGSTANAATPAAAQAVRAYLAGTPLDVAYRQAAIQLPPPGTPVTAPIDPSQLSAGDVGMFADHYVVALGAGKALKDGQVVALASLSSSPDFLGWMRPSVPAPPGPVAAPVVAPG